jgi:hypothetical protein
MFCALSTCDVAETALTELTASAEAVATITNTILIDILFMCWYTHMQSVYYIISVSRIFAYMHFLVEII